MGAGAPPITNPATDPTGLNTYLGGGSASLNSYPSGNPDVKPEKADTITFGAVFQPQWDLPGNGRITTSFDYYNIEIDGAIGYVNAQLSYQLCFNANGTSNPTYDANNVYCQSIKRSTVANTGYPTGVFSTYLNQGGIKTSGVDVQAEGSVRRRPRPSRREHRGQLSGRVHASRGARRSRTSTTRVSPAATTSGSCSPASATRSARWPVACAGGISRARSRRTTSSASCAPNTRCFADTAAYDAFDLYGNYEVVKGFNVRLGVDNLLDKDPPVTRGIPGSTDAQNYDVIGRRYYVALTARF